MNSFLRAGSMELDLHGRFFIISFFCSFWVYIVLGNENRACRNWTLSGGPKFYEGMLTVNFNGTTVNICTESFDKAAAIRVCSAIHYKRGLVGDPKIYSANLYSAKVEGRAISYGRCLNQARNELNTTEQNCKPVSLCCEDTAVGLCTKDWKYYHNEKAVSKDHYKNSQARHLTFDELVDYNYDGDVKKSWTRSALQEVEQCPTTNASDRVYNLSVKHCKKRCTVTDDLSFVYLHVENKPCCLENSSSLYPESDNCSISVLSVLPVNSTSNMSYCLAAEVNNASLYVSIEDCRLLFLPFMVPDNTKKEQMSNETSTTPEQNSTQPTDSKATKPSTTLSAKPTQSASGIHKSFGNTVIIAISICVSLLVLVFILFTALILWKFKQSERKREQQRPNSVSNRTYHIEGPQHSYVDDEEYTLITDMEFEHGSANSYKPPVPDRGDSKTGTSSEKSTQGVITLGEYCSPSDQLRVGYKISQTSDYCMTTYDDPTRHKSTASTENSSKRESFEKKCSCDNKEEQLHKRYSNTNSIILGRSSRNSEILIAANNLATTGLKIDTNGKSNGCAQENAREEGGELNNIIQTAQKENSEKHTVTLLKADGHFEIFTGLKSKETETEVKPSEKDGGDSDYEDPSALGEIFQTTNSSKPVLEEHVCLDCLKPEHLTKLGIKIISEEMYEKRNDLQRSRSDPSSEYCNCNNRSVDETNARDSDNTQCEVQKDTSDREMLAELGVLRSKKSSTCTRRCSVCHTVYERLGIASQNAWSNCTDNVYDKFGDFMHFKHRQQISGKRINST